LESAPSAIVIAICFDRKRAMHAVLSRLALEYGRNRKRIVVVVFLHQLHYVRQSTLADYVQLSAHAPDVDSAFVGGENAVVW
jgi:hypothetical protein